MTEIYMVTWCIRDRFESSGYFSDSYIILYNTDLDMWVEDTSFKQGGSELVAYDKGPTQYYNNEHEFCTIQKIGNL